MQRLNGFLRGGTRLCFMELSTAQSPNYLLVSLLLTCGMASEYPVDFAASLLSDGGGDSDLILVIG